MARGGLDLGVVDYLQMVQPDSKKAPRQEQVPLYQIPLYDGLTRLGSHVTDTAITRYFKDDPLGDGYSGDPLGGYREEPGGGHRPHRRSDDYSGDPLTGGYAEDRRGGYAGDPLTGDYPTGPSDSGYPDASGNPGYSPARPYVAPGPGSTGGTAERRGRRRPARGEESDPSPDSFPYGRPSADREVRGRGR